MNEYKTCSKCKQIKLLIDFHRCSSCKDGLKPACKTCNTQAAKDYAKANPEKTKARIAKWRAQNKDKVKNYSAKARIKRKEIDRELRKDYYQRNKSQIRKRYQDYVLANQEKVAAKGQRWRQANPDKLRQYSSRRRALVKGASVFSITEKEIAKLRAAACFYCGRKGGTLDHVIPLVKGGLHSIGNIVGACERCNKSKADKIIMEWKKVRGW